MLFGSSVNPYFLFYSKISLQTAILCFFSNLNLMLLQLHTNHLCEEKLKQNKTKMGLINTISKNSATQHCTNNTWKDGLIFLTSMSFFFPFYPYLHFQWRLAVTGEVVQATSMVMSYPPPYTQINPLFQITVEVNHNSLTERRNQTFAPNYLERKLYQDSLFLILLLLTFSHL